MRRGRALAVAAVCLLLVPVPAWAIMTVFDPQSFSRLGEQLTKLQKQVEALQKQTGFLGDIARKAQDQIDAIGRVGQVALPVADMTTLARQVRRDAQCLLPDLKRLMPSIEGRELAWTGLCARRGLYEKHLWFDPEDPETWDPGGSSPGDDADGGAFGGASGPASIDRRAPAGAMAWQHAQDKARARVMARRRALVREAFAGGLARGDAAAAERAETEQRAADEAEEQAAAASDVKGQLAAANKLLALLVRQRIQANQQLAQLIRIQSAMLMEFEPADNRAPKEEGEE